jgi:carbamate kinase
MDGSTADTGRTVVALGGNTLLGRQGPWTIEEQRRVVEETAERVAAVIEAGDDVVLTHGNGPQVGNRLLQQEHATETPQLPLDVLVAETQAQIGYLLQQALDNRLESSPDSMTLVTQVVVDADDPAFAAPTKPIGPFYTATEAAEKPFETRAVASGDRPHRRVVPSPHPVELVEADEIASLVASGSLVICAGGGGIPVVRDGGLRGVEAVVDKDRTSGLLALTLDAETLVVLTDVEYAYVNYDSLGERALERCTPDDCRTHLAAGEFGSGTMRPKVEACLRFVEAGGTRAVITTPDRLAEALAGDAGTQVRR